MMVFKIVSFSLLCLLAQGKPKTAPVPTDFAIRVSYGDDIIDTFQNLYTRKGVPKKHLINEVPALIDSTVSFRINSAEKAAIYSQLTKMRYTTYPNQLKSRCVEIVEPGVSIVITVHAKNEETIISYYDDCISTRDEKAIKIKSLVALVNKIARSHDEVKRMPASLNVGL
ncbi:hypothetical protein GCM10027594_18710 [Hymenobacter agri]